jgi:hypothetical protein
MSLRWVRINSSAPQQAREAFTVNNVPFSAESFCEENRLEEVVLARGRFKREQTFLLCQNLQI